ncbi:type II secretion system protein [Pelomonas sp. SE-A7]|uniref:PulJ/GspJ family protein n=1 Tax=Pelomonas sp. SE-A7 TaxID=3054953 RepID=UPI00259D1479|nr:type II secretion system protein [Pelomonas sp. SE-A7]MDM4767544.1 type II secretion system protein [Pelomonas sp. SE-A7]
MSTCSRSKHRASHESALRGFTLVEMLVSMVIVAMISAMLWQAMQLVMRVELMLQGATAESQLNMVRREWVRGLIEGALPEQLNLEKPQFQGDATELRLASGEALDLPGVAGGRIRLRLVHLPAERRNELQMSSLESEVESSLAQAQPAVVLLRWQGPAATFKYLGDDGQWLEQWPVALPAAGAMVPHLPRAVLMNLGAATGGPLLASIGSDEAPRMRRLDWERQ